MSGFSSAPDSFQQKTTAELQYLVENPTFYDAGIVARARQELRQRGALAPVAQAFPEITSPSAAAGYDEAVPTGQGRGWLVGGLLLVIGLALAWWALRDRPTAPAATAIVAAKPIVLEATAVRPLPSFEPEAAVQVARTRRLLPAADRADTTAAGRYARMARRYWLAENTAAHLTAQALTNSATKVFPGQASIGLERINWFMSAMVYDQNLTPEMDSRLRLMQGGLTLRRSSLIALKTRAESGVPIVNDEIKTQATEATSIAGEVLGQYQKAAPIRGQIQNL